jgi:cytochrome c-type biogenesis protein CcmH/NrfG
VPTARAQRLIDAAEAAAQDGAFSKAIGLFKTAVRLDPHRPKTYLHLAELYLALAMEREAERAAKEALTRAVAAGDKATGAASLAFLRMLAEPADPV